MTPCACRTSPSPLEPADPRHRRRYLALSSQLSQRHRAIGNRVARWQIMVLSLIPFAQKSKMLLGACDMVLEGAGAPNRCRDA